MGILFELVMQFLLLAKKRKYGARDYTFRDVLHSIITGLFQGHYIFLSPIVLDAVASPVKIDPQRMSLPGLPNALADPWYLERRLFVKSVVFTPIHLALLNFIRKKLTNGALTFEVKSVWAVM